MAEGTQLTGDPGGRDPSTPEGGPSRGQRTLVYRWLEKQEQEE